MNASMDMLLDRCHGIYAEVIDCRESFDGPFDIRGVQDVGDGGPSLLESDIIYVGDAERVDALRGRLAGMTVAVACASEEYDSFARDEGCRVVATYGTVRSDLLNALLAAQRAVDELDARLMWASFDSDPLGSMVSIVSNETGEPVLVTDADEVLVAYAVPEGLEVTDKIFLGIRENNCLPTDDLLNDISVVSHPGEDVTSRGVQHVSMPDSDQTYLDIMVVHEGEPFLDILVSDEGAPFCHGILDTLYRLKLLIERAVRAGSPLGFPPPDSDSCVRRLLDHIFVREEVIDGYLRKHGWRVDDRFYCVLARVDDASDASTLPILARRMRLGPMRGAVVLVHKGEVACVARAEECPYDMDALSKELGSLARRFSAKIGVSCPFHDFRETRRYYDSCRTAIEYGELEDPPRAVSFYDDYAARHLEKVLFGRAVNEVLLDARAVDLKQHDDEQGGDLLRTLLVYLECGQNKTLAAQQLFIHRNTLIYRLGTIERVTGVKLEKLDADRLFHLMYTCRYLLSRG